MIVQQGQQTIDTGANIATYGGAGAAVAFWGLNISELAVIVSAVVAALGLMVQIYFHVARDRREREFHRRRMETLNDTDPGGAPSQETRLGQGGSARE